METTRIKPIRMIRARNRPLDCRFGGKLDNPRRMWIFEGSVAYRGPMSRRKAEKLRHELSMDYVHGYRAQVEAHRAAQAERNAARKEARP